jgi:hypothetical protein
MERTALLSALVAAALLLACEGDEQPVVADGAPATLAETGLSTLTVQTFAPQYPLWTDGAAKQRWIYLPGAIDASQPDAWELPVGTRLWKSFAFDGAIVETRYMERRLDGWVFATYVDGVLVTTGTQVMLSAGRTHVVPSAKECLACHGTAATPVLGFSALQLSTDRDPNAIHGTPAGDITLATLVADGHVASANIAPRIAARSPQERAVLGYLHGNCGHCHRAAGPLGALDLDLARDAVGTTVGHPSQFHAPALRITPGAPAASVLVERMRARDPITQMPPLGTQLVDDEAVRFVTAWIAALNPEENL